MSKVEVTDMASGFNLAAINSNFDKLAAELNDKVLYRSNPEGEPNQMGQLLDMNSYPIINLPEPVNQSDAARLKDVQAALAGATQANLIQSTPHGSVAANTVQGAINELADEKANASDVFGPTALANTPFLQGGTGAVSQPVLGKLRQVVSVFDFLTAAQQADVKARTALIDVRAGLQAAFNYVNSLGGGTLFFPSGKYMTTGYVGTTFWDPASEASNVHMYFDNAEVYFNPNYTIPSGTWFWHVFSIEGNNVSITGNVKIRSNQTLLWNGNLPAQRTNYLVGVVLGGKGYGHITMALGQEREGVIIEGVDISDFHLPIVAEQASRVKILNNKVANDTDTGILIENCLEDIEVAHNRCINSGDDHFFARHYANTPWATAGRYIGNVRVHHNYCENNFAKFMGFGGYSDVIVTDNYCRNSWFAGMNVECDTTWYNNNNRIKFSNNIIREAGRAWDPAHPLPVYRVPVVDTTVTVAIYVGGVNRAQFIEISNNTFSNPQSHGVSIINAFETRITGNTFTSGIVTKAAVNYGTTGAAIYISDANRIGISGNVIGPDQGGNPWAYAYEVLGDAVTQRVHIIGNPLEEAVSALFVPYSAAMFSQVTYQGPSVGFQQAATPSAISTGAAGQIGLSCPGALPGDIVQVSFSNPLQGLVLTGFVPSNDNVTAVLSNLTGGTVSVGAGTFKIMCSRKGL